MPKRTRRESQDINENAAAVSAISQVMAAMGLRGGLKGAVTLHTRLTPGPAAGFRPAICTGAVGRPGEEGGEMSGEGHKHPLSTFLLNIARAGAERLQNHRRTAG